MYVCPDIKVIYLAQPRTGSRSIRAFLYRHTTVVHKGNHHYMNEKEVLKGIDAGYKVVTAVRNHFDIIVSWYYHNRNWFGRPKGEETFANYVRDFTKHKNNTYVIPHRMYYKYQPVATHVIKFENLWTEFSEATGMRIVNRQRIHSGKSERGPYREYYDEETRAFVEDYYRDEMEEYGYEW